MDFCAVVVVFEICRDRGNSLQRLQRPVAFVVSKYGDRGMHFANYVGKLLIRAHSKMPWSSPRVHFCKGRSIRCEGALGAVEFVDHYFVQAKIVDDGEAVILRKVDRVRVRTFLALGVRTFAGMLIKSRRL